MHWNNVLYSCEGPLIYIYIVYIGMNKKIQKEHEHVLERFAYLIGPVSHVWMCRRCGQVLKEVYRKCPECEEMARKDVENGYEELWRISSYISIIEDIHNTEHDSQ